MKDLVRSGFCIVFKIWLSKFVDHRSDPIVRLLNILESDCKYCQIIRWLMAASGVSMMTHGYWLSGLSAIALAYLFTLGERHWLCESKH